MSPYRTPALTHGTRYGRQCQVEWLNDKQLRVLSWWVLPLFGECLHRLQLLRAPASAPTKPQALRGRGFQSRGVVSPAHVDMPVPRFPEPGKVPRYVRGTGTLSPARSDKPLPTRPEPGKVAFGAVSPAPETVAEALPEGPAPGEEPME